MGKAVETFEGSSQPPGMTAVIMRWNSDWEGGKSLQDLVDLVVSAARLRR